MTRFKALLLTASVISGILASGCYVRARPGYYYGGGGYARPVYGTGYYARPAYYNGGGYAYGNAQPTVVYRQPAPVYYNRPAVQVRGGGGGGGGSVGGFVRGNAGGGRSGAVEVRGR